MMKISFNFYRNGKKKALTMSYDDGNIQDRQLIEIFNQFGIKSTFHLNTGLLDSEDKYLKSCEIKNLFEGHEVAVHSVNHPFLTRVSREALVDEILEDRKRLEALVGYPVMGMSYPFGDYNENVLRALNVLGIEYSRTAQNSGNFKLPDDFLIWHPTCHHEHNILNKYDEFKNTKPWHQMPLFYIWGHSWEFNVKNNWELIEEFCKKVAEDESIWFATNIEIFDYIMALKNLKFSVDRKIIINPSAISVWIGVEEEALEIKPGEKIILS